MTAPSLLQRAALAARLFARGVSAAAGFAGTAFQGAARDGGVLRYWRAALASADRDDLGERAELVSRQRDLARNDTAVASAKRRRVSSAVGAGWQLVAEIDGAALGLEDGAAETLNAQIERAWRAYAFGHTFEMDAQRKLTFGGLLRTAAATWFVDGEIFALAHHNVCLSSGRLGPHFAAWIPSSFLELPRSGPRVRRQSMPTCARSHLLRRFPVAEGKPHIRVD